MGRYTGGKLVVEGSSVVIFAGRVVASRSIPCIAVLLDSLSLDHMDPFNVMTVVGLSVVVLSVSD